MIGDDNEDERIGCLLHHVIDEKNVTQFWDSQFVTWGDMLGYSICRRSWSHGHSVTGRIGFY